MIPRFVAAAALLAVSACAVVQTGGAGQTSSGEPIVGDFKFDQGTRRFDIALQSPRGWVCSSSFVQSAQPQATRTVPLTCNDGRTGNLIMSANQFQDQATGSFYLSNGESGQVTFGRL
ncbi:hypothetical protein OE699_01980 [Sedimentimonas flavescens]|uniref:Protease inhibitor Inh n=1 Tax=Sedimentimonas flavescens TaxID=2851012 RepID=A0ABT2ZV35_9RHOB|nr:hypothetical protein [Sedimentimonas flavescens]MCV2877608.1 hypothetical protein [Sedimentimonas flavescens]